MGEGVKKEEDKEKKKRKKKHQLFYIDTDSSIDRYRHRIGIISEIIFEENNKTM